MTNRTIRLATLCAALIALPVGVDGLVSYSQAAVLNDDCHKPAPKLVKKVGHYSIKKGYVPLTSKILAKVSKSKPKPKPKIDDCAVIKPVAMPAVLIDSPVVVSPDLVTVAPVRAVDSVVDHIERPHAYIAPLQHNPPAHHPMPWQPIFGAFGSWIASPIYFTSIYNNYGPVVPTAKPTVVSQSTSVPVAGSLWLLIAGLAGAFVARKSLNS